MNEISKLFTETQRVSNSIEKTCLTCDHRQPIECGSKVIQYCGLIKSRYTNNGKLKIKCKNKACLSYKEKSK